MLVLRRSLAAGLDLFFVSTYLFAVAFTYTEFAGSGSGGSTLTSFVLGFPLLYYGCLECGYCGAATLGKRLLGLEVRTRRGASPPLYSSMARALLKLAFPCAFLTLSSTVLLRHPVFGGALALIGLLLVPISLILGRGYFAVYDAFSGTCVDRRGATEVRRVGWAFVPVALFFAATVAFPLSAVVARWFPGYTGQESLTSSLKDFERSADIPTEILTGKGSEVIRPFVKGVYAVGALERFPEEFSTSVTQPPAEAIREFRGRPPALALAVDLSDERFASSALRFALISRIGSVLAPMLNPDRKPRQFVWLYLTRRMSFGPLDWTRADSFILLLHRSSPDAANLELWTLEPDHHRSLHVGLRPVGFSRPGEAPLVLPTDLKESLR